jgi:UDP-N-acetylmuramate--alanine ligase
VALDLSQIHKIYVIGIKGSGVIAVVQILKAWGKVITGSDTNEKFFTESILKKLGINFFENFSEKNITDDIDLVIYSTAYNRDNNIEFAEAQKRRLKMISYPEILGELFNQKYGIAVCGTHGKTTTSALLAFVFKSAGLDPSAAIGSQIRDWGSSGLAGQGDFFIIEADEYQNKFLYYQPKSVILTSSDWDHPDCFKDFKSYKQAFIDFVKKIPKSGFLVVWGDSASTVEIASYCAGQVIKYGFLDSNDVILKKIGPGRFKIMISGKDLGEFSTRLVGDHNLLNAAAVITIGHKFNINVDDIRKAVASFQGTTRRFEIIGERNGAIIIDDYGHHPEEIIATLKSTRELYPENNIIAVFHPHSYTRTEALLHDFSQSFNDANRVIVLDIYGSARENSGKVSSQDLVNLINKYDPGKAEYIPKIEDVTDYLKGSISIKDLVITIGAGNVNEVAENLVHNK